MTKHDDIDDEALKEAFRIAGEFFDVWYEYNEEVTNNPNLAVVRGNYYLCKCDNCDLVFSSEYAIGGESLGETGDYNDIRCPRCNSEELNDDYEE